MSARIAEDVSKQAAHEAVDKGSTAASAFATASFAAASASALAFLTISSTLALASSSAFRIGRKRQRPKRER